ncbi:general secretion pathway protein GspB [Pseudomonas zhanjiangensis]|uniref:General secretion pathway protein GspB n=1 Tax=Pseudomonas zhanjiangensis TaxID=3239015 RepID=A0ABV3YN87_9PSED
MSYILNALKHSESQRNRGEIPHIDSQPEFVKIAPSRWGERLWKWLALAAVLGLLLSLAWMRFASESGPEQVAVPPSVEPAAGIAAVQPSAEAASPAPEPAPGLPALAEMAGVRVSLGEEESGDAAVSAPAPPKVVLELPVSRGVVPAPAPKVQAALAPAPVRAPAVDETPPAEDLTGVSHWKTLPGDVQKQLRELAFTAHIYSSKADARFIRVSGRTLHEGDQLATGLTLRQITRDGIVFSHGGEQYWFGFN